MVYVRINTNDASVRLYTSVGMNTAVNNASEYKTGY